MKAKCACKCSLGVSLSTVETFFCRRLQKNGSAVCRKARPDYVRLTGSVPPVRGFRLPRKRLSKYLNDNSATMTVIA